MIPHPQPRMTTVSPLYCINVDKTSGAHLANQTKTMEGDPDRKVHGAHMGPTWVLSASDGPHVGPINLASRWCSSAPRIRSPATMVLSLQAWWLKMHFRRQRENISNTLAVWVLKKGSKTGSKILSYVSLINSGRKYLRVVWSFWYLAAISPAELHVMSERQLSSTYV